jgi:hypothetical protein
MTVNSRVVLFSIAAEAQAVDDLITAALRLGTLDIAVTRTMAQDNLTLTYQVIGANSTRVSAGACSARCSCCATCTVLACSRTEQHRVDGRIMPLQYPCAQIEALHA